jgi:hypothetical protein
MKRKTSNKLSNDSIVTNASSEEDSERRKLLFSLENAFSISYVTLISIIQGGAFGYWVDVLDRMTDQGRNLTNINFESWLLILLAFILIVTVWNEYMMLGLKICIGVLIKLEEIIINSNTFTFIDISHLVHLL